MQEGAGSTLEYSGRIKRNPKNGFFDLAHPGLSTLWVWAHVGERAKCQNFGVCQATFGYGRPPRSVGPLGLAVEIVSIGYGPVPHRIWGPGAAAPDPSQLAKRRQERHTLRSDRRDTLFSYYGSSQPLFGKAAEAAKPLVNAPKTTSIF